MLNPFWPEIRFYKCSSTSWQFSEKSMFLCQFFDFSKIADLQLQACSAPIGGALWACRSAIFQQLKQKIFFSLAIVCGFKPCIVLAITLTTLQAKSLLSSLCTNYCSQFTINVFLIGVVLFNLLFKTWVKEWFS